MDSDPIGAKSRGGIFFNPRGTGCATSAASPWGILTERHRLPLDSGR
jgi:hypothetical protein